VGYSGVLFGYITLWSDIGEKHVNVYGIFRMKRLFFPWIWLAINTILIPEASFIGHLSGILCGVLILLFFCTEDTRFCGEGWIGIIKLAHWVRKKISGYEEIDDMQMRRMQIGRNLP
jgi:hypothetical protein